MFSHQLCDLLKRMGSGAPWLSGRWDFSLISWPLCIKQKYLCEGGMAIQLSVSNSPMSEKIIL